jgi:transcriptional regulator with PAS, ATPase and Fis domain
METKEQNLNLSVMERELILKALKKYNNNQSRAAAAMGISESQIRYRIKHHKITISKTVELVA